MKVSKTGYLILTLMLLASCSDTKQTERLFQHFIDRHVERVKPINIKYNEAVWATYSGQSSFAELLNESRRIDSLYKKAGEPIEYYQALMNNVYDNSSNFEILLKIKKSGLISDSLLKRQFTKIFREYISIQNNWDESENRKTELYEQFYELKRNESAFWDSIKQVDSVDPRNEWIDKFRSLTDDFKGLINSMNADSKKLGYGNYFQLLMDFTDVNYDMLDYITSIIDDETREDYLQLLEISKDEISEKFNISKSEIRPKHYSYSVQKMMVPDAWEKEYTQNQAKAIMKDFFAYGNFNIDAIWNNSNLWYNSTKFNQSFFFCANVDSKDYRIYANSYPNTYGLYNLFHEFGHAVHYQSVDHDVPYLLKEPNCIATEAVGIYFNDKIYNSPALRNLMELTDSLNSVYYNDFNNPSRLIFLRKLIRTIQFEKSIFENPDQNFNELWWALTEQYLLYEAEEKDRLPEWITNQHIINLNGIHVHYLLAFAVAAQLEAYYPDDIIGPMKGFMRYGNLMSWDKLLERTTGEELNLSYLFNSYKRKKKSKENIIIEMKQKGSLSFYEQFYFDDLTDRNIVTISN